MQPHNPQSTETLQASHAVAPPPFPADPLPGHEAGNPAAHHVPTGHASGTGRKLLLSAGILAVVLGGAFAWVHHHKTNQEKQLDDLTAIAADALAQVEVSRVSNAPADQALVLPGQSRAWYESTIYARVNGYLHYWKADIGDHVTKGQTLATIDTPDLDAQLQAAQQEMAIAQSQVEVAQASEEFAKTTYDRWKQSPQGVVSDQERDQKKSEYESALAGVKAAQSKYNAGQSEVARLTAMEAFKNVTAPFEGVITARHIDIGDLVTAGSTTNTTSLYQIAQVKRMRVFIDVPQSQSAAVVPGIAADLSATQFGSRTFQGKVTRTSDAIDAATGTLHVEVDVDNSDQALIPGMYLQVSLHVPHAPMMQVPASALLFHSDGTYVAVVGSDEAVQFHKVKIGVDNGDVVDLTSGVSADQRVALNLSSQVVAGQKVDAVEADAPAGVPAATAATPTSLQPHVLPPVASTGGNEPSPH